MTELSREILKDYEIRKTRKQKTRFIEFITKKGEEMGYEARVEAGSFGARNIVFGDPERARVIYTAHYDTCAGLPFPNLITPKSIPLYLLYQIVLTVLLLAIPTVLAYGLGLALWLMGASGEVAFDLSYALFLIGCIWVIGGLIFGPANKHAANDNTSGVTTVVDIMQALPEEMRPEVAFVLFDLEEAGLLGSTGFAAKHKKKIKDTPVVNFDCVGDGDSFLFILNKRSKKHAAAISEAFGREGAEVISKGVFYPSDNISFPTSVGVGAFNKTRRGILYLARIHTKRDTVLKEENIDYLTSSSVKFTAALCGSSDAEAEKKPE